LTAYAIKEEFGSIKSNIFERGFEHHKSRYVKHISILILVISSPSILANIIGMASLNRRY
jgi:hypothetical protein